MEPVSQEGHLLLPGPRGRGEFLAEPEVFRWGAVFSLQG